MAMTIGVYFRAMKVLGAVIFPAERAGKTVVALVSTVLFLTLAWRGTVLSFPGLFLAFGFFVFYLMMHEDYHEQTVHLPMAALLATCFALFSGQVWTYFLSWLASLSVFQSLQHLMSRPVSDSSGKGGMAGADDVSLGGGVSSVENGAYGWLPSFGLSLLFFLCIERTAVDVPDFLVASGYGMDYFLFLLAPDGYPPAWLSISFCLFWLALSLRDRLDKRERSYAFGDGDGYVFAAFLPILGVKWFLLVLFLNMLLLLFALRIPFVFQVRSQKDKKFSGKRCDIMEK